MQPITVLPSNITAPIGDSADTVLYASTTASATATSTGIVNLHQQAGVCKYRVRIRNSHVGTLKFQYATAAAPTTWVTFDQYAVVASATGQMHRFSCRVDNFPHFRALWTNGGTAQNPWVIFQVLECDASDPGRYAETSARVRGTLAGTNNFAAQISTTGTTYAVSSDWPGRRVRIKVRGATLNAAGLPASVWINFGVADTVNCNRGDFVTGTPPAWTGDVDIGTPIADGELVDWYIDPTWTHFCIEADTASTEIYISLSDYQAEDVS